MKKAGILFFLLVGFLLRSHSQDSIAISDSLKQQLVLPDSADSILESASPLPLKSTINTKKTPTKEKEIAVDTVSVVVYDTIVVTKEVTTKVDSTDQKAKENKIENSDHIPPALKSISETISFSKIFWSIITLILSYYIIALITLILRKIGKKNSKVSNPLRKITPFVKIIGWIIASIVVIEGIIRPPSETLFAVIASTGIAIGFAAQDVLKNIFGGIMILFDRPFQIGDKIEIGEYYGEVKEIGLRSTRVVTPDDSVVTIPNAELINTAVSNANSGENNCQVVAEVYLPIDIDTNLIRKIATETAQTSRYIYLNKPITVLFINEITERKPVLKMRLKAYVSNVRYEFNFKSDMTEVFIKELLDRKLITK